MFHAAETTSLEKFPETLLQLLHRHLVFDGAVFGHADPLCYGEFSISVGHVHQRELSILDEYKDLAASDSVTQAFLAGLLQPLAVDTEQLYGAGKNAALLAFTRRHRLRHLLLCGYPPSSNQRGRWIVLYRADDHPFETADANWFGAFCMHLDRALDLNRFRALDRLPAARRKALALVDGGGRIEMAEPVFPLLLKTEFKDASPHRLPAALVLAMRQKLVFQGRHILGRFSSVGSHHVCELREAGPLSRLSPRESQVARRFAQGFKSREIATEFGVAVSTVHSQLSSIYRKLEVSEKASLARLFAETGG